MGPPKKLVTLDDLLAPIKVGSAAPRSLLRVVFGLEVDWAPSIYKTLPTEELKVAVTWCHSLSFRFIPRLVIVSIRVLEESKRINSSLPVVFKRN